MANQEYSLLFKINAALSDKFGAAMRAAQNAMKGLQGTSKLMSGMMTGDLSKLQGKLRDLTSISAKMRQFTDLQQQVGKSTEALNKGRADSARLNREYAEQVKQTAKMAESLKQFKQYYKDNKANMSAEERAVVQGQIKDAAADLQLQRMRESDAKAAAKAQSAEVGKLEAQLEQQKAALRETRASLNAAGINASNFAAEEARLRAEIERTTAALERQTQISANRQRFSQAQQGLSDSYGNLQNSVDTAKTIFSPFKSAIDEAVSYEQNLSKLKALTQTKNIRAGDFETVNREMSAMDATIKNLGATTEFTTNEVAQAAQKFAMSGWGSQQIQDALKPVIDITTATGNRDVVKIADYLTDEMQALGLTDRNKYIQQAQAQGMSEADSAKYAQAQIAKNMQSYGDAFAYALTQSNNDADSFHEAMKYMAPVGTQAGMSVSEQVAMAMTMADSGIKGSMGGTAGRMGILRLIAPPKAAVKAMESMGLLASDAQKAVAEAGAEMEAMGITADDSIGTRIQKLKKSFEGMDEKEVAAKLSKITGVNAVSGWGALLKDLDKFNERVAEMDSGGINGWAETVAATMRDNTATDFELFKSAVAGLSVTVGNVFLPAVRQAAQGLTQFVSNLDKFAQANPGIIQGVGAIAAGLSGLIVASAGAKMAMAGWEFVSSGFLVLKDTITSAALAVASLPARLATAFAAMRGMSFASMFAGLGASLLPVIGIAAAVAAAGYFIYQNWSSIAPLLAQIGSTISASLSTAFAALSPAISNLITAVQRLAPVFSTIGAAIGGALLGAIAMIANFAATLITTFANAVATIINLFAGLGNALASLLAMDFSKAGEYLKQALISAVQGAFDTIKSLVGGLFDTLTSPMKLAESFRLGGGEGSSGGGSFGSPTSTEFKLPEIKLPESLNVSTVNLQGGENAAMAETIGAIAAQIKDKPEDNSQILTAVQAVSDKMAAQDNQAGVQAMQDVAAKLSENNNQEALRSLQAAIESLKTEQTQQNSPADFMAQMQQSSSLQTEQMTAAMQPVIDSFTNLSASVQPVSESFTQISAGVTTFNAELTNTGAQLQAANAGVMTFTASLTGTNGAITGFTGALTGSVGAVTGLGSAASGASGSISGLGSAAGAACAALAAAGANAAAAVNAAAASIPAPTVAANFRGGIYPKGEFITTFAEKSAEAAIPLDNSSRAISLWERAGQILGVYPGNNNISFDSPPKYDKLADIAGDIISNISAIDNKRNSQLGSFNSKIANINSPKYESARSQNIFSKKINLSSTAFNPTKNISSITSPTFNPTKNISSITSPSFNPTKNISSITSPTFNPTKNISSITSPSFNPTKNISSNTPTSIFTSSPQNIFSNISDIFSGDNIFSNISDMISGGNIFSNISDMIQSPASIFENILNPTETFPTADNIMNNSAPIDLHFEINIAGNANAEEVRNGIEQSIPMIRETFEEQMASYNHERQRVSFA